MKARSFFPWLALQALVACHGPESTSSASSQVAGSAASSAVSAAVSADVAVQRPTRDGEAEVEKLAPFDPQLTDENAIEARVLAALAICGGPTKGSYASGAVPATPDGIALCSPKTHAKLLALHASFEATNPLPLETGDRGIGTVGGGTRPSPPTRWDDAVAAFRLALALDSTIKLPAASPTQAARDAFAAALELPRPAIRLLATETGLPKSLEQAIAVHLPAFAHCYGSGLSSNPNLQGDVTISGVLEADGFLSGVGYRASLPDLEVVECVTSKARRAKLDAGLKPPQKLAFLMRMTPDREYPRKRTPRPGSSSAVHPR